MKRYQCEITCKLCGKPKGGKYDHSECSKKLQEMHANDKHRSPSSYRTSQESYKKGTVKWPE